MAVLDHNSTVFVFPGQGSQMLGMGKSVYDSYPVAKEVFEEVNSAVGFDLSKIIFGSDNEALCMTQNAQPALMVTSIAILRSLQSVVGLKLSEMCFRVAGHSLGEYSALCAANSISLKDTANILNFRGQAMKKAAEQRKGAMMAIIGATMKDVEDLVRKSSCGEVLSIANDNSDSQVVISGDFDAISRAEALASECGVKRTIRLAVSGAFHSPLMNSAGDVVSSKIESISFSVPDVPVISNVSANSETDLNRIVHLLKGQITSMVRWREVLLHMEAIGCKTMIEIGSGRTLCGLAKKTVPSIQTFNIETADDVEHCAAMML